MKNIIKALSIVIFIAFCMTACGNNNKPNVNNNTDKSMPYNKVRNECDIELIARIEQNIDKLSQEEILKFLMNISKSCENNAEFMEYYNEVLFSILDKYPVIFCNCMSLVDTTKQVLIFNELAKPVNDIIDLKKIKKGLEGVDCKGDIKSMLIEAINTALNKYN